MQSNLAAKREYNFEQFEQTASSSTPVIEKVAKREAIPHPAKILAVALVILAIVFSSLYGRVQIAELNDDINVAAARLEELNSEKVRMEAELDGQMSLSRVEEIALEELGMVKPDNSQVTYLQIEQANKIQTTEQSRTFVDILSDFFARFGINF